MTTDISHAGRPSFAALIVQRFRTNPLIMAAIRPKVCLDLKLAARLVIFLFAINCIACVMYLSGNSWDFYVAFAAVGTIVIISNPLFVSISAAGQTVLAIRAEQYELVATTALSGRKIVEGFMFQSLYRCRIPLIVMLGVLPAVVVTIAFSNPEYYRYRSCLQLRQTVCYLPLNGPLLFVWLCDATLITITACALNILAAALGVGLGLWWRQRQLAELFAVVLIVVPLIASFRVSLLDEWDTLGRTSLFALITVAVTAGVMRLAENVARHPS